MMATYKLFCQKISIISLILCISHAAGRGEEKRWSRQISNSGFLNDWIPVQPMGKILIIFVFVFIFLSPLSVCLSFPPVFYCINTNRSKITL